jgi:hypothetical protein
MKRKNEFRKQSEKNKERKISYECSRTQKSERTINLLSREENCEEIQCGKKCALGQIRFKHPRTKFNFFFSKLCKKNVL